MTPSTATPWPVRPTNSSRSAASRTRPRRARARSRPRSARRGEPVPRGDPTLDTADFPDDTVGNLRVDYVLPSNGLDVLAADVFWPSGGDALSRLVRSSRWRVRTTASSGSTSSDRRSNRSRDAVSKLVSSRCPVGDVHKRRGSVRSVVGDSPAEALQSRRRHVDLQSRHTVATTVFAAFRRDWQNFSNCAGPWTIAVARSNSSSVHRRRRRGWSAATGPAHSDSLRGRYSSCLRWRPQCLRGWTPKTWQNPPISTTHTAGRWPWRSNQHGDGQHRRR